MLLIFSSRGRTIVKFLILGIAILSLSHPNNVLARSGNRNSIYAAIWNGEKAKSLAVPVADAGYDQTIGLPKTSLTLYGVGYDPDGSAVVFLWTKQSGPAITISGTASSMLLLSNLVAGTYVFRLTVTDNSSTTAWDEVTVVINDIADNRSYVREETVLKSGITTAGQLPSLTVNDKSANTVYYDASGKQEQAVVWQGSPSKKDQVGVVVYDELGRQNVDYMPMVHNSTDGLYKTNVLVGGGGTYSGSPHYQFYHGAFPNIVTDDSPFARIEFEKSPLARTIESGGYGAAFQPNLATPSQGKTTKASYTTNGDNEVLQLFAQGIQLTISSVYFPAGVLNVNTVINADNFTIKEYYNSKGQKILQRAQANTSATLWIDTYYVYDEVGNLIFVIPPQLSKELSALYLTTPVAGGITGNFAAENTIIPPGSSATAGYTYWQRASVTIPAGFTGSPGFYVKPVAYLAGNLSVVNSDLVSLYAFQNTYDDLNRLIASKSPGADWEYFVYDKRGRLVLSQDGNQRLRNEWKFAKYDMQDRPVMTGLVTLVSPVEQIRSIVASQTVLHEDRGQAVFLYTNNAYPNVSDPNAYLAITYYDDIQTIPEAYAEIEKAYLFDELTSQTIQEMMNTTNNKGLVVHTKKRVIGTGQWLSTSFFYDRYHRNVFASMKEEGTNVTAFRELKVVNVFHDFTDRITKQKIVSNAFQGSAGLVKRFEYDHAGRLLREYASVDIEDVQPEIVTASYEYNELGEVVDKKIHSADNGATWLQSLDYRYNIQGTLTTVNNLTGDGSETDYFGLDLSFNNPVPNAGNTTKFSGLISAMRWKSDLTAKENLYNFDYNQLGQITSSTYKKGIASSWGEQDKFSENNLSYDLNGNISSLTRYQGSATSPGDQLNYHYGTGGNQLKKVVDNASAATAANGFKDGSNTDDDYGYDVNGNLIYDKNKGIAAISYNYLNLPDKVTFNNNTYITYSYDASGVKLTQTYFDNIGQQLSRIDYLGEFIIVDGQYQSILTDHGRIVAPSYTNLIANRDANSLEGFTASGNVTLTAVYQNNETYLKAVCNQSTGLPGIWPIAGTINVKEGEKYSFKILGYSETVQSAYLYVKGNSGDIIWTGALLPQGLANETWVTTDFVVPAGISQISVGVRWSNPASGAAFYINRVALYKLDWEHQYFINDHLGSTRVVLGTNPAVLTYTATFETENQTSEATKFLNIDYTKVFKPIPSTPSATPGGDEVIRMNNTYRVGPARSFKVFPGDKLDASVHAYYDAVTGMTKVPFATMATALMSVMSGGVTAIDGGISSAYNNSSSGLPGFLLSPDQGSNRPSAFINYILFDANYAPLEAKSVAIGSTAGIRHQIMLPQIDVKELGYVFIYLSYDNESSNWVYFDDLKITYTESPVLQVNAYYPYGMTAYSWVRDGEEENKLLFQGKEYDSLTGWHNFHARQYDAAIGRWVAVDPAGQFASSYVGLGNSPINGIDPDGRILLLDDLVAGAIGGLINLGVNIYNGNLSGHGFWSTIGKGFVAFGAGAVAGYGSVNPQYGGWIWGGATVGAANAYLSGADGSSIVNGAALGAVSSVAGGFMGMGLSPVLTPLTQGIISPALRGAVNGAVGGSVTGAALGGLGASVNGGNFLDGAFNGALTGAVAGALSGGAASGLRARMLGVDPFTGRRLQPVQLEVPKLQVEVPRDYYPRLDRSVGGTAQGPLREMVGSQPSTKPNGLKLISGDEAKLLGTARHNLLNSAQNVKLRNIINDLYRATSKVGNGSAMAAYRTEQATGGTVGGKTHGTKLIIYRNALLKVWDQNISPSDRAIVKYLLNDIQNALSGN